MQREMTFAIARAFGATARAEEQQRNTNLGRSHTMDALNRYGPLVGRILLGLIFVVAGFGKITGYAGTMGYMASHGLPMVQLLLPLTILVELGGGLMLVLGWNARLAAGVLFLFIIPTTLVFHNFWAVPADQMQGQMNNFLKNLAIMGGMIYVVVFGSGPLSLKK
jgi:putative oxidoreductase